jgi:hypothetical protein
MRPLPVTVTGIERLRGPPARDAGASGGVAGLLCPGAGYNFSFVRAQRPTVAASDEA